MVLDLKLSYPPPKIVNHSLLATNAEIGGTLKPSGSLDFGGISRSVRNAVGLGIPAVFDVKL
jgi:hypothetical protein